MADLEEGVPTPNLPPAQPQLQLQPQLQPQDQQQQQVIHLNWSNFKPEFSGNLLRMQRHICSIQMIG